MFVNLIRRRRTPIHLSTCVSILFAVALPFLPATSQAVVAAQSGNVFVDRAGGADYQIDVVLTVQNAPAPGGVAAFTFDATPLLDAPDLTITWELPDGGVLQGGSASEPIGAVAAMSTVRQTRQVQFPNTGTYAVRAQATYHPNRAVTLTAIGVLFFTIDTNGSVITDQDPRAPRYQAPPRKFTIDKSGMVAAAQAWGPNAPQGCFIVQGVLTRNESQPAANPTPHYNALSGPARPVHNVVVEMREEDTFSDDSYGYTVTDANGRWEFRFCDDDGVLNDELELYMRVCSEVWDGANKIARIEKVNNDELFCFDTGTIDSEGGTVDFGQTVYDINSTEAALFNIADAVYWNWKFWNFNLGQGAPFFDRTATVKWERGQGRKGSATNQRTGAISIADDPSDPDEWDDSVIMHEWTHFATQNFSCARSPGGPHSLPGINAGTNGDKLAWNEGIADYYQSAARTVMPGSIDTNFYIDVAGPTVDFETYPSTASALDEGSIAALLWDFFDNANDGSDTVTHGQDRILKVFADPAMQSSTQCNMQTFLQVWKNLGLPTDAATAATVVQNVAVAKPFGALAAATPLQTANIATVEAANPLGYRWWDQVTMVVDNSTSMAGPAGTPKFDAVKALIKEQVNDLSRNPHGTEFDLYAFNAGSPSNTTLAEGRFFSNQVDPVLDGLAANGADSGCPVAALGALTQAVQGKYDGQAWVYTDGDEQLSTSVDYVQQQLNERLVRGSVVLLGGCNTAPTKQSDVTGAEKSYLGLAADGSQPGGIVPYLLTAVGTGGQFLYVAPDQLANAVDILRAQASHSAGAGRWSDYVSNKFTYRWDRLLPSEYQWLPAGLTQDAGQLGQTSPLRITLPAPFNFYGSSTSQVDVYDDGYIRMNPCDGELCQTGSKRYANILYVPNMQWTVLSSPNVAAAQVRPAENGNQVHVWTGGLGLNEWFIISTEGEGYYGGSDFARRAYQVWLNQQTGEIRYLYDAVRPSDTGAATISVSDQFVFSTNEVVVSNQDLAGAVNGGGYKFTPAPPQPSKSYTVSVDSQIQSIGFLQTGYSGSLAAMAVTYPDGSPVDCNDTEHVRCLSLNNGLTQYVQTDVEGRTGIYTAIVSAGASGEGTFSFNALGASLIHPSALGKRARALKDQAFLVDLGFKADDNTLAGWLQTATGAHYGNAFTLFDDGLHGDGLAEDGVFGSDTFTPPNRGVAYLWTQGQVNGETITRNDSAPFNFQPIDVAPEQAYVQGFLGTPAAVSFLVTNQDSITRCYNFQVNVPAGWNLSAGTGSPFCVAAGATDGPYVFVNVPLAGQLGGVTGKVSATFTEVEEGRIAGGDTATVTFFRSLKSVEFDNRWDTTYLRPNSTDTVSLTVNLLDDQGHVSGWTGALGYTLDTTLGTVTTTTGIFDNGRLPVLFSAGDQTGEALVTFVLEGNATTTTTLQIRNPTASDLVLVATPKDLPEESTTSSLTATLLDAWGDPVEGQMVRFNVSGDLGDHGTVQAPGVDVSSQATLQGSEVFTATTGSAGQASATFVKAANASGQVVIRAEALVPEGSGLRVSQEALQILSFSAGAFSVGGTVSGLAGSGLVLQNNGGDDLPISTDGAFTFATKPTNGSPYAVTVKTQPTSPAQSCTVANDEGTLAGSNVTNVAVSCTGSAQPQNAYLPMIQR